MTDHTNDLEQAERIRRLQERRAASSGSRRPTAPRTGSPATSRTKTKRQHPAAATRWMLAGLSVASFFTIAGTVAVANVNAAAPTPASTPTAVVAVPTAASTQAATPAAATPAAPTQAAPRASTPQVSHTTTRGS